MAVLKILKAQENEILRQKAIKVSRIDRELRTLLDDMAETLEAGGGLGLAAPQVGVGQRLIVVKNGPGYMKLVNPSILRSAGEQESPEACLSIPGVYGKVRRPAAVAVKALDENGKLFVIEGRGPLCCTLCHELDHLDGILFTDKAYQVRRQSGI
jgi:peptide deformylase